MEDYLVSVGVVTYNSSKTVIETLESIKNQTYQRIELIVSDDGSHDNTIEICREWLQANSSRFVRTELLTVEKNTGTAANCNRCSKASQGYFIKRIAGDDLLEPWCIQVNIENIGNADMAVSDMVYFEDDKELPFQDNRKLIYGLTHLSPPERLKLYCRTLTFFNPPSLFFRKSIYDKVGYYDEESGILEDVPFLVKVFKSKSNLTYIQKTTVRYRSNGGSHSLEKMFSFQKKLSEAFFLYCRPYLSGWNPIDLSMILEKRICHYFAMKQNAFVLRIMLSRYNLLRKLRTLMIKGELDKLLKQ